MPHWMGSLSTLSISGPIQNKFTAMIRRESFSYCHLPNLDNFCCTLDPLYQLFTSNRSTRMANKQAWHCHTFIWPYKWSRECWNTTGIARWIIIRWGVQVPSELAANSQTTENHCPSAITMYNQPTEISDDQLRRSVRSLIKMQQKLTTGCFLGLGKQMKNLKITKMLNQFICLWLEVVVLGKVI